MGRSRQNIKGRRTEGGYAALPHAVLRSSQWANLSSNAIKLLVDLLAQYNGFNNGDLCASWSMMKARNWKSKDTLSKALKELLENGWLLLTRQGGRHKASLYALTFYAIDACSGKLDVQSTNAPPANWRKGEPVVIMQASLSLPRQPGQSPPDCNASRVKKTAGTIH